MPTLWRAEACGAFGSLKLSTVLGGLSKDATPGTMPKCGQAPHPAFGTPALTQNPAWPGGRWLEEPPQQPREVSRDLTRWRPSLEGQDSCDQTLARLRLAADGTSRRSALVRCPSAVFLGYALGLLNIYVSVVHRNAQVVCTVLVWTCRCRDGLGRPRQQTLIRGGLLGTTGCKAPFSSLRSFPACNTGCKGRSYACHPTINKDINRYSSTHFRLCCPLKLSLIPCLGLMLVKAECTEHTLLRFNRQRLDILIPNTPLQKPKC